MTGPGLAAALVVLVAANLLNNRVAPHRYLLTSTGATTALLGLSALAGVPWGLAGLGAGAVRRGLPWAVALVLLVGLAFAVGVALPVTRPVFRDRRVLGAGPAELAYQTLLRIPVGTVLLEEVAFRGVLYAMLRHCAGTGWATAVSATMFGLWHVLPAAGLVRDNPVAARVFDRRRALVVPGSVLATALAGVLLCELQRRSGSLLSPFALHWAVNGLGYATAWLLNRRATG